ncbi:hypothetical protein GIB67_008044 [Kingdonia uniflora]|uniref:Uncharacterized protein n=1 Tax=Kingdonia uniflora TaxID=39325 RepID=A0A7J7MN87_9MAGN|nr:hypothetical protein GIB67_008044 [Kingdonia uniflora]
MDPSTSGRLSEDKNVRCEDTKSVRGELIKYILNLVDRDVEEESSSEEKEGNEQVKFPDFPGKLYRIFVENPVGVPATETSHLMAPGINGVQLYTIVHFGGDIIRPKIGSIICNIGGSTKHTSLRVHSSYKDFVILLEEISKIYREECKGSFTTKDTGSGRGLSTTKAGGPLRHNSFPDPKLNTGDTLKQMAKGLIHAAKFWLELQPEKVNDLLDFRFKSAVYMEDPYDFSKEFNIGNLYRDRIKLKNHIRAYAVVNKFNLKHVLSIEYKTAMRGIFEHTYQLLTSYHAEVRLVDPDFAFDIQTTNCKDKRFTRLRVHQKFDIHLVMFGSNFHGYDTRFVVITDRNPGIINAVPKVFLFAIHTFCSFCISNNIKTTLESMRIAFRMAAETLTSIDFGKHMNAIRNTDPVGLKCILGIPKERWSNLYIPMSRFVVTLYRSAAHLF